MLCEECGLKEATYAISVMMEGESTTRHLCADCMAKMNATITAGNIKNLLSSILSAITGAAEPPAAPQQDMVCPRCLTTLSHFTKTGHLGCPGCYDAFRDQLQPMLLQIHGRVQHAGRKPLATEAEQHTRSRREQLTELMAQAVAVEDFETAAQLRDQLRALNASKEVEQL